MRNLLKISLLVLAITAFLFITTKVSAADGKESMIKPPIIISEVYPHPKTGEIEFVELKNISTNTINLKGWKICDELGSVQCNVFSELDILKPGQYIAFSLSPAPTGQHRIYLNDDGDVVSLYDDTNQPVFSTQPNYCSDSLKAAPQGQSYNYDEAGWYWAAPTPNTENTLRPVETVPIIDPVTIEEAKTQDAGDVVTIRGTVTVLPGVLSTQYFYIQDEKSGIQVYSYDKEFPTLGIGDYIEVKGELSSYAGEKRLKISAITDIKVLESKKEEKQPEAKTVDQITQSDVGELIQTQGVVTETSGDVFSISANSQEIKVIIRDGTKIDKPAMKRGDTVAVSGVVSTYKEELRILPISQENVKIIAYEAVTVEPIEKLPEAGPKIIIYILGYFVSFIICVLFHTIRTKQRISRARSHLFWNRAIFWRCTVI